MRIIARDTAKGGEGGAPRFASRGRRSGRHNRGIPARIVEGAGAILWASRRDWYRNAMRGGSAAIAAVAAFWFIERALLAG